MMMKRMMKRRERFKGWGSRTWPKPQKPRICIRAFILILELTSDCILNDRRLRYSSQFADAYWASATTREIIADASFILSEADFAAATNFCFKYLPEEYSRHFSNETTDSS